MQITLPGISGIMITVSGLSPGSEYIKNEKEVGYVRIINYRNEFSNRRIYNDHPPQIIGTIIMFVFPKGGHLKTFKFFYPYWKSWESRVVEYGLLDIEF